MSEPAYANPVETTEHTERYAKMNANTHTENTAQHAEHNALGGNTMTTQNINDNTAQQTEHTHNEGNTMNANNTNQRAPTIDLTAQYEAIYEAAIRPRSSIPRKLGEFVTKANEYEEERARLLKEYGAYSQIPFAYKYDLLALKEELSNICMNLAKTLIKRAEIAEHFDSVFYVSGFLKLYAEDLVVEIAEVKEAKAKAKSAAKAETRAVDYAKALTEGQRARSDNFAKTLKAAALLIAYRRGADGKGKPAEYMDVDAALNKVYAAMRRQAKKNGVDIGEKSNKPTKDTAKAEILTILLRMIENHEHEFDVIIEEC